MLGGFLTIIVLGLLYMLIGLCVEYAFHKASETEESFDPDFKLIVSWIKRLF